jgi:hypothetical protein
MTDQRSFVSSLLRSVHFGRGKESLERIQARLPLPLERIDPVADLLERCRAEVVDAPPGDGFDLYDPRLPEHTEVFGDLRLTDAEPLGDVAHREGPQAQQFDDL